MDLDNLLHGIRRRWRALRRAARRRARPGARRRASSPRPRSRSASLQPSDTPLLVLAGAHRRCSRSPPRPGPRWPLRRRPDDRQIARFVEERVPELDDAIVTAVEIQPARAPRGEHTFAPLVVAAAARAAARHRPGARRRSARDQTAGRRRRRRRAAASRSRCSLARPFVEKAAQVAYIRLFPASVVGAGALGRHAGPRRPARDDRGERRRTARRARAHRAGRSRSRAGRRQIATVPMVAAGGRLRVAHRGARAIVQVPGDRRAGAVATTTASRRCCRRACSGSSCTTTIRRSPA